MKKILILLTVTALLLVPACVGERDMEPISLTDTVEITMPGIIFGMATGEENMSPGTDLTDYSRRNGFMSAKWNVDHSLTVIMSKDRYADLKAEMSTPVEETLEGVLTYPYVVDIEKNLDYESVIVIVDSTILEEDGIDSVDDIISYYHLHMLGTYINVYRMFVGLDNTFSIYIVNSETGVNLGEIGYPLDKDSE